MSSRSRLVGHIHIDSAQILILDPVRLNETQYDSLMIAQASRVDGAAEVWIENEPPTIENFLDPPRRTNDGVVVETGRDGSVSVFVDRAADGRLRSIRLEIE